jgi:hypothetical protein
MRAGLRPRTAEEGVNAFLGMAVAVVALASEPGTAPGRDASRSAEDRPWDKFNVFALTVTAPNRADRVTWRGAASFTSSDLRIEVDQVEGGKRQNGTMIVVGGRVLAARGLDLPAGYEIDALDAPVLSLRIITAALGRVFPAGPDSLKGKHKIDHRETHAPLQAGSPSAGANIPPPWTLKGRVERQPNGVEFDLELAGGASTPDAFVMHYVGSLARSSSAPTIDDSMSLRGWKIYTLGPHSMKQGGATILDYGATKDTQSHQTVADIRAAIKKEDDPGKPDPSMDFTGFWKQRCDQNFGLRIQKPAPGMPYFVSFCGPGGCDEPGRASHITGDRRFRVVGPDEFQERSGDDWTTYRRCRGP